MRVIALQRESHVANGVLSLSVSARITEVLEYMQSKGMLVFASVSELDPVANRAIDWADVLILSKHSSIEAVRLAKKAKKNSVKIIYDIDDWIFSFPKYSAGNSQKNKLELIHELIDLADVVTVANDILLHRISEISPDAVLVPNGMWVEKYSNKTCKNVSNDLRPRIVFTNADLIKMQSAKDMLFTALQVFFMKNPHYILDFYGDPFPEMHSLPFLHFTNRMPYEDYMKALVSGKYQFSISPLGSDEDLDAVGFNVCKNPFKYLNYGAAKVPGIYSSAAIYKNCISDGKTGLLVNNDYESWLNALESLSKDKELRSIIRKSAFDDVMSNYHVSQSAKVLSNILGL